MVCMCIGGDHEWWKKTVCVCVCACAQNVHVCMCPCVLGRVRGACMGVADLGAVE